MREKVWGKNILTCTVINNEVGLGARSYEHRPLWYLEGPGQDPGEGDHPGVAQPVEARPLRGCRLVSALIGPSDHERRAGR